MSVSTPEPETETSSSETAIDPNKVAAPNAAKPNEREASEVHLVLYDGECGLCNRGIRRLMSLDQRRIFRHAPLKGETAKELFERHGLSQAEREKMSGMWLAEDFLGNNERLWTKTDALCGISRLLGGAWFRSLALTYWIPRPLRDAAYAIMAANRHRFFGKADASNNVCTMATPAERQMLLP